MKLLPAFILILTIVLSDKCVAQWTNMGSDALSNKAEALRETDMEESLNFSHKALKAAEQEKDTFEIARSLLNIGLAMYYTSRFDGAIEPLQRSYKMYEALKNQAGISTAATNLGLVYIQISKIQLAEKYFNISYNIDRSLKDTAGMAIGLNNLAKVFHLRGNYALALEYFEKSGLYEQIAGNDDGLATAWINTGVVYSDMQQYDRGNAYFIKALRYFEKSDNHRMYVTILIDIGDNERIGADFGQARQHITKAIAVSKKYALTNELIQSYIHYSKLLLDQNQIDSADYYLFKAMDMCVESGNDLEACEAMMQRGILLAKQQKYEESTQYLLNAFEFASNMQHSTILQKIALQLSDNYAALNQFSNALKYQKIATEIASGDFFNQPDSTVSNQLKPAAEANKGAISNTSFLVGIAAGIFLILILTIVLLVVRINQLKKQIALNPASGEER